MLSKCVVFFFFNQVSLKGSLKLAAVLNGSNETKQNGYFSFHSFTPSYSHAEGGVDPGQVANPSQG